MSTYISLWPREVALFTILQPRKQDDRCAQLESMPQPNDTKFDRLNLYSMEYCCAKFGVIWLGHAVRVVGICHPACVAVGS